MVRASALRHANRPGGRESQKQFTENWMILAEGVVDWLSNLALDCRCPDHDVCWPGNHIIIGNMRQFLEGGGNDTRGGCGEAGTDVARWLLRDRGRIDGSVSPGTPRR